MFLVKIKYKGSYLFLTEEGKFSPERKEAIKIYSETDAIKMKRRLIEFGFDARTECKITFGGMMK